MKVRYDEDASVELETEVGYYEATGAGGGEKFHAAVLEAEALVVQFPQIGSVRRGSVRRVVLNGYPFDFLYRVGKNEILVIAIAHHARKPFYWGKRDKAN